MEEAVPGPIPFIRKAYGQHLELREDGFDGFCDITDMFEKDGEEVDLPTVEEAHTSSHVSNTIRMLEVEAGCAIEHSRCFFGNLSRGVDQVVRGRESSVDRWSFDEAVDQDLRFLLEEIGIDFVASFDREFEEGDRLRDSRVVRQFDRGDPLLCDYGRGSGQCRAYDWRRHYNVGICLRVVDSMGISCCC